MPDYQHVGQTLMNLSHLCVQDEYYVAPEVNETEILEGCFSLDVAELHVPVIGM